MDAEAWRAAKGVLAEALSCPPGEREALLVARCPDLSLRREVQAFLNEYDEHFLESVISVSDTIDSTNASDDAEQLPDIRNGDRIGPYVVLDRLGVGGMGMVFLGNDTRLQRKVALKCLSASASAGELRVRILHEARAAARITHPNIAIVHDVIEHEDRPFLVMEYVEGENLAELIKRERPPIETIVMFMRQLASALAAAHGKGVVHRDLKPANIQVTPDGSVKILDFGVAHAMSAAALGTTASVAGPGLTVPMATTTLQGDRRVMHPGTPAYMSPEQMFGRPIDQRSDIYSLGVIVYEMATGHRPYSTDDPLEVVLTLSRNFLRPDDAQTHLPAQVNGIVSKMLAVKPEDRYQTAGELENALVALTATTAGDVAPRSVRSRLQIAGRYATVAMALVAGVTVLGYLETVGFNQTLGRTPPFDHEPPSIWLQSGLQSLFLPALYMLAMFIGLRALQFGIRVLRLSRSVEHLVTETVTQTESLTRRLALDDPGVFGQAVAGAAFLALAAAVFFYIDFIRAWGVVSISQHTASELVLLQSGGAPRLRAYGFTSVLMVLLFVLGAALLRIQRLRATQSIRRGRTAVALVSLLAFATLGLDVWPYRILIKSSMPRLDVAGERCFELGEASGDLLIHCPDRNPPRNRVIRSNDASVRRLGVRENIFDPPKASN
jgi:serine/threonine protein kinase